MAAIPTALQQEISQLEANFCAALSDPTRLLILYALNEGPHNVTELTVVLGVNQPTVSRHLKILRERGLVRATRRGTTVTYELVDPRLIEALDLLRSIMRDRLHRHASLVDEILE
jgi:ArsR family transcriptional regulator